MIIGRSNEQKLLKNLFQSDKSEFVAVYGRRRVGKTYLIRECFNYNFAFQHTGVQNANRDRQLEEFRKSLNNAGADSVAKIKDWFEAFDELGKLLSGQRKGKKVVFIDEMPWMDTLKSDFVSALEHFWNGWATMRKDILLIVCGSATSWIINKLVNNHGGLHNRLTRQIYLRPFTLKECELYNQAKQLEFPREQILLLYMILGGIPYYWSYLQQGLSWAQNIDYMFFGDNADLRNEFDALYASLFRNSEPYIKIVRALGKKKIGMTRGEIASAMGEDHGGTLTSMLRDLEQCSFIRAYNSIGKSKKDTVYQLVDNFTLFYFRFMEQKQDSNYWVRTVGSTAFNVWCGLAFERVCFQHIEQIKKALGISGVISNVYSWIYRAQTADEQGVQIDMLIDREDDTINLCEIKYSDEKYKISKSYSDNLRHKTNVFKNKTNTRKAVFTVMITTKGLLDNPYARDIQNQVVMEDLFE